ncbi:EpsD family peptidyl-prolyl cis-trans isomerase [Mitsuaria sp. TWR114]|uniref:EpsD family peptidyl-prolyl cis-trans isomerase n=1 Tax=Mitsuaria sp. TWR114 TaxID=2601731 RepID=UPI002103316E|nr:EpsD family peptidyl-prolyl cis-trans isomerase [Mitsuaria sp. TWR114]
MRQFRHGAGLHSPLASARWPPSTGLRDRHNKQGRNMHVKRTRVHGIPARRAAPVGAFFTAVLAAILLTACGGGSGAKASQTAAKVNKEEITVHQINFVLQRQPNIKPEQVDAASRQILERLIDQELAVQKAQDLKLDRDPRVVQQIETAKREIIARAYADHLGETVTKPTDQEIKQYYNDKPALFAERRIYNLQEINIEAKPINSNRSARSCRVPRPSPNSSKRSRPTTSSSSARRWCARPSRSRSTTSTPSRA